MLGFVIVFYILLSLFSLPFHILLVVFSSPLKISWEWFFMLLVTYIYLSNYMLLQLCFGPAHLLMWFLSETASNLFYLCSISAIVWWGFPFYLQRVHIPCSIYILGLLLGWQVLGLLLICSHHMFRSMFLLFHSVTKSCIRWVFSLTFTLLSLFFHFPIMDHVHWSLPAVLQVLEAAPGDLSYPLQYVGGSYIVIFYFPNQVDSSATTWRVVLMFILLCTIYFLIATAVSPLLHWSGGTAAYILFLDYT